jgi:hypothetical protein
MVAADSLPGAHDAEPGPLVQPQAGAVLRENAANEPAPIWALFASEKGVVANDAAHRPVVEGDAPDAPVLS